MRRGLVGYVLHVALVKTAAARVTLHDSVLVDPDGIAAQHESGLRPHHSTGATAEDPLLFRHRYQHHDEASGKLIYYQYEAKRHPNVVMLADLGVLSCQASVVEEHGQDNVTEIVLVLNQSSAAVLSTGSVISGGDMHCWFRDAEGTLSSWRKTLRERVLSATTASAPKYSRTAVAVTLLSGRRSRA